VNVGVLTLLVFVAGVAAVVGGGVVLGVTGAEYSGCTDECHGALFFGVAGLALIVLGLLVLLVGVALLSQRDGRRREQIDRELRVRLSRD
jgi:hypothetical protein